MTKKITDKKIIVNDFTFGDSVTAFFGDFDVFKNVIYRKHNYNVLKTGCKGLFVATKGKSEFWKYYIWMPSFSWSILDQCTLIHELSHVVYQILDNRGIREDGNNEVFSYLQDFYMYNFWNKLGGSK